MKKAILISIRPEYVLDILNGTKTLELRKTVPKDYKGWVYIYCTKSGGLLVDNTSWINFLIGHGFVEKDYTESPRFHTLKKLEEYMFGSVRNTKVVARFWFDEYEGIDYQRTVLSKSGYETLYSKVIIRVMGAVKYTPNDDILDKLCLTYDEVENYGKGKDLYAWHIKKLEIFDAPLSLNDFYSDYDYLDNGVTDEMKLTPITLKRPPQSYQFVYRKGE